MEREDGIVNTGGEPGTGMVDMPLQPIINHPPVLGRTAVGTSLPESPWTCGCTGVKDGGFVAREANLNWYDLGVWGVLTETAVVPSPVSRARVCRFLAHVREEPPIVQVGYISKFVA